MTKKIYVLLVGALAAFGISYSALIGGYINFHWSYSIGNSSIYQDALLFYAFVSFLPFLLIWNAIRIYEKENQYVFAKIARSGSVISILGWVISTFFFQGSQFCGGESCVGDMIILSAGIIGGGFIFSILLGWICSWLKVKKSAPIPSSNR